MMMFLSILLLIQHSSHCCVIEWTDSTLEMVTEADISDFDGKFTVNWAHLVKHPHCVVNVMVAVNHRTAFIKRCSNCGKQGYRKSAKFIAPITVRLKEDRESVCSVNLIEVFLTDLEGATTFTRMEIDPVKRFFDSSKNVKVRAFGQTADVFWLKGGMFSKSEKLKTKCLEEGNIYDAGRMLHQLQNDASVLRMDQPVACPSQMFSVEYIFRNNPTKPKATFFLPTKEFCEAVVKPSTDVHPLKQGNNEILKTNRSLENPDKKTPTRTNTEYTSPKSITDTFDDNVSTPNNTYEEHSAGITQFQATDHESDSLKTTAAVKLSDATLNVSSLLFVNHENNSLESTTSNPEIRTDQSENTEKEDSTPKSTNDQDLSHQMMSRDNPDENIDPIGIQQSKDPSSEVKGSDTQLLQLGTGTGVTMGLLIVIVLGVVAKRRRSSKIYEGGGVVLRDGVDENPLYGHLRESDLVEMRDVNTYYAGPLDSDSDDSD